jgi:predicted RNase H-like nuclease (RuvC/YqgF family)
LPKFIVGVDPGVRAGIAGIDIATRHAWFTTLAAGTSSRSSIVSIISDRGEPVLFATDRSRVPDAVRKVAAAFGCKVWAPRRNIGEREKLEVTRGLRFRSRHERDALAAALVAWRRYSKLFEEIDAKLKRKGLAKISADVKALVVKKRISIARAIEETTK